MLKLSNKVTALQKLESRTDRQGGQLTEDKGVLTARSEGARSGLNANYSLLTFE